PVRAVGTDGRDPRIEALIRCGGLRRCRMSKHNARSSLQAATGILAGVLLEFAFFASPVSTSGANAAGQEKQATSDVTLTAPPGAPVDPVTPPLHLSDVQRKRISEVLKKQDTETEATL